MPNAKQSTDTITHDYAASAATYANPAVLSRRTLSVNSENSAAMA